MVWIALGVNERKMGRGNEGVKNVQKCMRYKLKYWNFRD